MKEPLIKKFDVMAKSNLGDEYIAFAYTIEQSLIAVGATPNEDYSLLDLYKLAQPFVIEVFKAKDDIEYLYPSNKLV